MVPEKRGPPEADNHYNPEKAREYRETFQQKHPLGRTWAEHIAAWREAHPEYRERSNEYAKKSKLVAKLRLKKRLRTWGLAEDRIPAFLRIVTIPELDRLVLCLEHWDILTSCAKRTPERLLDVVRQDDRTLLIQVLEQVKRKRGK